MEYYSAMKRDTFESALMRGMNAELIIKQWSKREREKQLPYINTYIWDQERWYWWIYVQGSDADADRENRLMDVLGEGEGGMNRD